jgi:hypothetical protein
MLDKNLPPSDILIMAYSPAAELTTDTTAQDAAVLDILIQRYTGNPNINQDELIKLDWARKLGQTIANQVILPKDQVEALAIEATRQQVIELQSIIAGQDVPVSPRDNDMVHIDTMIEKLMPVISNIPPGGVPPEGLAPLLQAMNHFQQHVAAAEAKGGNAQKIAEYKNLYKQAVSQLYAGQQAQQNPNAMPAAAMPARGGGGGGGGGGMRRPPSVAQQEATMSAVEGTFPSQQSVINQIANPPKPVTAG